MTLKPAAKFVSTRIDPVSLTIQRHDGARPHDCLLPFLPGGRASHWLCPIRRLPASGRAWAVSRSFLSPLVAVSRQTGPEAKLASRVWGNVTRRQEHTSELQSLRHLVCR